MVQLVSQAIWLAKPKWDLNYLVHIKGSKTTENASVRATTIVKNREDFEVSKQDWIDWE